MISMEGMAMSDETSRNAQPGVKSFEVAEGDSFGDLLSSDRVETGKGLKIGLLATGFFEYWRMYPLLKGMAEEDARVVHDRLS